LSTNSPFNPNVLTNFPILKYSVIDQKYRAIYSPALPVESF
jgi:hypothetical protein